MREKTEKRSADGASDWMLCFFGRTQYRRGGAREMSQRTINTNQIRGVVGMVRRKWKGGGSKNALEQQAHLCRAPYCGGYYFAREAACNYHVKAQRLSGVHASPNGSAQNVCLSRKGHTVGQYESKYSKDCGKCQEAALFNLFLGKRNRRTHLYSHGR